MSQSATRVGAQFAFPFVLVGPLESRLNQCGFLSYTAYVVFLNCLMGLVLVFVAPFKL